MVKPLEVSPVSLRPAQLGIETGLECGSTDNLTQATWTSNDKHGYGNLTASHMMQGPCEQDPSGTSDQRFLSEHSLAVDIPSGPESSMTTSPVLDGTTAYAQNPSPMQTFLVIGEGLQGVNINGQDDISPAPLSGNTPQANVHALHTASEKGHDPSLQGRRGGRRRKPNRNPREDPWAKHKATIYRLYVEEEACLDEVMATMKNDHGFQAREQAYKKILRRWGFAKNIPSSAMASMVATVDSRRTRSGKETNVYWGGRLVNKKKLERFKKRKISPTNESASCEAIEPLPNIRYETPTVEFPGKDLSFKDQGSMDECSMADPSSIAAINEAAVIQGLDQVISDYQKELYVSALSPEGDQPLGSPDTGNSLTQADSLQSSDDYDQDGLNALGEKLQQRGSPEVTALLTQARIEEKRGDINKALDCFHELLVDLRDASDPFTTFECLRAVVRIQSTYNEPKDCIPELERLVAGCLCFFGPYSDEYLHPALRLFTITLASVGPMHQHLTKRLALGYAHPMVSINPNSSSNLVDLIGLARAYLNSSSLDLHILENLISRILKSFHTSQYQVEMRFDFVKMFQDKGMFDMAEPFLSQALDMCFSQYDPDSLPVGSEELIHSSLAKLLFDGIERQYLNSTRRDTIIIQSRLCALRTIVLKGCRRTEVTADDIRYWITLIRLFSHIEAWSEVWAAFDYCGPNREFDLIHKHLDEDSQGLTFSQLCLLRQSCVKAGRYEITRKVTQYSMDVAEHWWGKGSKAYQAACEVWASL